MAPGLNPVDNTVLEVAPTFSHVKQVRTSGISRNPIITLRYFFGGKSFLSW